MAIFPQLAALVVSRLCVDRTLLLFLSLPAPARSFSFFSTSGVYQSRHRPSFLHPHFFVPFHRFSDNLGACSVYQHQHNPSFPVLRLDTPSQHHDRRAPNLTVLL